MSVNKEAVVEEIRAQLSYEDFVKSVAQEEGKDLAEIPARPKRLLLWDCFADEVSRHVEEYTVPQYGDFPDDQATKFTEEDLKTSIKRYVNRIDSNARGEIEATRDLLKIAHYASMLWCKRLGFEEALLEVMAEDKVEPATEAEATNE